MSHAREAEIDRHFAVVLDLPKDARARYLADLRARDAEVAAAVDDLLGSTEPGGDADRRFATGGLAVGPLWDELARGVAAAGVGAERSEATEGETHVGAYRVVGELGRGGMSVVYLAERDDGLFDHRVALKFLALGAGSASGVRRIELERQILASLNHPNIARLLDGGVDERGRPYIVMELVEGRTITRYCAEEGLSLDGRLDLFERVADAVGYAHRHLVVHRDIKPSNILVTNGGTVKLLDFGIARLLEPGEGGDLEAPPTRALVRVLTPEYASPEQVLGERITTSSDIYQLGLLLYELLTGRRPFDLEGEPPSRIEKAVCEEPPSRPSARVGARAADVVEAAAAETSRAIPPIPSRRLRGDLDNIVLKALEKAPERRYESVGGLADDLYRHRRGLPVRARAPTLAYRTGRFVLRHAAALAAAAVLTVLLVGYAVTVTVNNRRIAAEAEKTEQVKQFLASLFVEANPGVSPGADLTAPELVDAGARRVATDLAKQPEVQAEMMVILGIVYGTLGRYQDAIDQLERALAIQRRLHGPLHEDVVHTASELASVLHYSGNYEEAGRMLREVLEGRRHLFGDESHEVGLTLGLLGDLLHSRGEFAEAEQVLREALAVHEAVSGRGDGATAVPARDLANVLRDRGAHAEAEPLYRRSLDLLKELGGNVDPIVALTQNDLARLLAETGRFAEADALLMDCLSIYDALYASGHPMVGTTYRNLGLLRLREGRPNEAGEALEEALSIYARTIPAENPIVPRAQRFLARAYLDLGRPEEAYVIADEAVSRLRALGLSGHPAVSDGLWTAGLARLAQGRPTEAEALIGEALTLRELSSVPADPALGDLRRDLERVRNSRP